MSGDGEGDANTQRDRANIPVDLWSWAADTVGGQQLRRSTEQMRYAPLASHCFCGTPAYSVDEANDQFEKSSLAKCRVLMGAVQSHASLFFRSSRRTSGHVAASVLLWISNSEVELHIELLAEVL